MGLDMLEVYMMTKMEIFLLFWILCVAGFAATAFVVTPSDTGGVFRLHDGEIVACKIGRQEKGFMTLKRCNNGNTYLSQMNVVKLPYTEVP
jgi:hypothetical protein